MGKQKQKRTEIVVIGAGYAGLLAAVRLAGKTRDQAVRITLVNAAAEFVERLRLHQFAAGRVLAPRPIAATLAGTGIAFVQGTVRSLAPAAHTLEVDTAAGPGQMAYDYLVYALGSQMARDRVPGVQDHGYTLAPAGPLSAAALRARLPALDAAGGRVVVAGGGATGIEAAAELAAAYPHLQVSVLTRGHFGEFLGPAVAAYMRRILERRGVQIADGTTVQRVTPEGVETSAGRFAADLCLWTGGFVAPSLAREAGLAVNERGQIWVDPFLRAVSDPAIWAVGDAAQPIEPPGVPVRMSAATATILGAHGADTLSAVLHGKAPRPLSFVYVGQGIALGGHTAIGFNTFPDDRPNPPYVTGRLGYETRELFVRVLAALPAVERCWPGAFRWFGSRRYVTAGQARPAALNSRP